MAAVQQPTCMDCPYNFYCMDKDSIFQNGVWMHFGERFCIFGSKPHRFGRKDPKQKVPEWCPRRKRPCELRVYAFRSDLDRAMDSLLYEEIGDKYLPSPSRYVLFCEQTIEMTASDFLKRIRTERPEELLSATILERWVIEIDDGLKPVFFCRMGNRFEVIPFISISGQTDVVK